MFCSCVGDQQSREPACKHLWATIIAVDEGGYLSGPAKAGNVPPFVSETNYTPLHLQDEWDDDDELGEIFRAAPAAATETATTSKPAAKRELREWETKLQSLRSQMPKASAPGASAEAREREIFFEIDLEESKKSQQLVVQTSQRQRRSNGQWGKLKPLKLRPGRLEEIEHADDRRILAYLAGGTPERTGWMAQQAEFQTSIFRYRVPFDLCTLLLPMMAKSQRMRLLDSSEKDWTPLEWDESHHWHLCLCIGQQEDSTWSLWGEVRRDDERKRLEECDLILPGGLIVSDSTIAPLDDFGAYDWVPTLMEEHAFTAADGDEQDLVDWLLDMPALPEVELPEHLRLEEVRPEPTPRLVFRSPKRKGWRHERVQGNIEFDYLGTKVRASNVQWAIVQREEGRCILRDQQKEQASWSALADLGFRRLVDHRQTAHDVDISVTDLGRAVRNLIDSNWEVHADGQAVRQPAALKFNVRSGIDWFELTADVDFEGKKANFPELLSALARGDQTIRLDDGSLGILPEEWLQQYGLLAGLGANADGNLRFGTAQLGLIDALLSDQEFVDYDERYLELRAKLESFEGVDPIDEPENFAGELRPY